MSPLGPIEDQRRLFRSGTRLRWWHITTIAAFALLLVQCCVGYARVMHREPLPRCTGYAERVAPLLDGYGVRPCR